MNHVKVRKGMTLFAILAILLITLSGCGNDKTSVVVSVPTQENTTEATAIPTIALTSLLTSTPAPESFAATASVPTAEPAISSAPALSATQRNSLNMLNYLVTLTQEINASKNSRLYLEEAYSALVNDIALDAVDSRTQTEINYLLDTLKQYRMISVKRERLEYIYEQNKAQALRDAVPNPIGLLSAASSFNWKQLVSSVVYMAVDSYTSYQSGMAQADLKYLEDNWVLDDAQYDTLHEIRKGTFNYMVDTVRDNKLPGKLALNEQGVTAFVEWKGKANWFQTIQFFESHVDDYRAFGPYWLTLAQCYYDIEDYVNCLNAVSQYENLNTQIFRRDRSYAGTLPLAIVAASYVYNDNEEAYIEYAARQANNICENTDSSDWSLRYFAAQTYIGVYTKTQETSYLEKAYDIALNNVNDLIGEQHVLNSIYLSDIVEIAPEQGATATQKKEVNSLNTMLKEKRKTELPPVYEPLLLNCDLLFALTDVLDVPQNEARKIDEILHQNNAPLFQISPVDQLFWLDQNKCGHDDFTTLVTFVDKKLTVPVVLVSEQAAIKVTVKRGAETAEFSDWSVERVERKDKNNISTFVAIYRSADIDKFEIKADDVITVDIKPIMSSAAEVQTVEFTAVWNSGFLGTNFINGHFDYQRAE